MRGSFLTGPPYTTSGVERTLRSKSRTSSRSGLCETSIQRAGCEARKSGSVRGAAGEPAAPLTEPRSEEHTSELQSRLHLVCRLLLEKKKKKKNKNRHIRNSKDVLRKNRIQEIDEI